MPLLRSIAVLLCYFLVQPLYAQSSSPFESFVPTGWNLLESVEGDLDGDGIGDAVLVLEKKQEKKEILQENKEEVPEKNIEEFPEKSEEEVPGPPRKLLILLKRKEGYHVIHTSDLLIPSMDHDPSEVDDPYRGVDIKKGCLKITTGHSQSQGSWWCDLHKYIFRYEKKSERFRLIGSEHILYHKGYEDDAEVRSVNYLTHQMKTINRQVFDDPPSKPTVKWSEYKGVYYLEDIYALDSFGERF